MHQFFGTEVLNLLSSTPLNNRPLFLGPWQ